MNFQTFLAQAATRTFWEQNPNLCFTGSAYPLAFFSLLFGQLKKLEVLPCPYQRIFVQETELSGLQAALAQSILGMQSFFWLADIEEVKGTKALQQFNSFLASYKGPNHVAYFIQNDAVPTGKTSATKIEIPAMASFEDTCALADFFGFAFDVKKKNFLKKLFYNNVQCPLDTCCMLVHYLQLLGSKSLDEAQSFFAVFTETDPSLFQLGEHFFAKNAKAFFQLWQTISKTYPDIFWIVFFSEQLWRAIHTVTFLQKKDFVAAKKMSYRLPSRFLHKDWQQANVQELIYAYEFLYLMDYALKTGSIFCACELFFMKYFSGAFASV